VDDFISLYKRLKARKEINLENYVIEDYLLGLSVTQGEKVIAGPIGAIPKFYQQLNILKSVKRGFESSLYQLKEILLADLFDSELEAAKELSKQGFQRGAGSLAGVVLEKHLANICSNHSIKFAKNRAAINKLNSLLKDNEIIDMKTWRFVQHLADLRNMAVHDKEQAPTKEDIQELIQGVEKISKTVL